MDQTTIVPPVSECRECKDRLAELLNVNPGWWCTIHGAVRADKTFLADIREVRAADKERIAALEAAIRGGWKRWLNKTQFYCGFCEADEAEAFSGRFKHLPDCIVLTLPNQGRGA